MSATATNSRTWFWRLGMIGVDNTVLCAMGLEKEIGGRSILRDISLELGAGASLAVIGPNGAGKTTLLRILAGLWGRSGGTLERFGILVPKDGETDPRVGFLGHQSFLYPELTLRENLRFYARLWGLKTVETCIDRVVELVGMGLAQHDAIRTYSRGMIQRGTLARVMLTNPQLLLLDEPFSGLDDEGRTMLKDALSEMAHNGVATLLITHRFEEAVDVAQAVTILHHGSFVWWASMNQITPKGFHMTYTRCLGSAVLAHA